MKFYALISFLLISSLFVSESRAQQEATSATQQPQTRKRGSGSRFSYGVSTLVWREEIKAKLSGTAYKTRGQAFAIGAEGAYEKFMGRRAQYFWSAKAGFMTGTMYAGDKSIANFKASSFIGGYFEPGVFRRQSAKSEFGLIVPLTYRIVNWESYNPELRADSANDFSVGIGGRSNLVFANGDYLTTGLVYQFGHPSAMWVIAYNWR